MRRSARVQAAMFPPVRRRRLPPPAFQSVPQCRLNRSLCFRLLPWRCLQKRVVLSGSKCARSRSACALCVAVSAPTSAPQIRLPAESVPTRALAYRPFRAVPGYRWPSGRWHANHTAPSQESGQCWAQSLAAPSQPSTASLAPRSSCRTPLPPPSSLK